MADVTTGDLDVSEVMIAYLRFAKGYYVKNGRTTKEYSCLREAFAFVRPLYGGHLANEFGPLALKTVCQK